MLTTFIHRAAGAAVLLVAPLAASGASLGIAELAPPETAVILSIDDVSRMRAAFDRTGFNGFFNEPSVKRWMADAMKSEMSKLEEALDRVDADPEDIGFPEGPVGAAMWFGMDTDRKAFRSRWLATADYGDRAEEVMDVVVNLLEERADRDIVEIDENEYGDATVFTIKLIEPEPEPMADEQEDGEDWEDEDWEEWEDDDYLTTLFGESPIPTDHFHIARVGSALIAAGDMGAIERAVDIISGDAGRAIGGEHQFNSARAHIEGSHASMMVFLKPFIDRAARLAEAHEDGGTLGELPIELFDALGVDEIVGASFGLRLDADNAMAELGGGVLAPNKEGVLALFNVPGDVFRAPAFAGADASSLTAFRFNFSAVPAVVQRVIMAMPEDQRVQAQATAGLVMTAAAPLFQTLGPDIVSIQTIRRPFSPTSQQSVYAIRSSDTAVASNLLTQFSPMVGLTSRDFEGNQIWQVLDPSMGTVPAIGVGFGHLFIGPVEAVEDSMRMAGRADAPRLSREASFERAANAVEAGGVYYSFTELRASLEYGAWAMNNQGEIIRAQMEPLLEHLDPEVRDEYLAEAMDSAETPEWAKNMPPVEVFLRHLGDLVGEIRPTPDGYRWRTLWLAPAGE